MKLPDIKEKKAIFLEARTAFIVIIRDVRLDDDKVEIELMEDDSIQHLRTWYGSEPYKKKEHTNPIFTIGGKKDTVTLSEDYVRVAYVNSQLFIDTEAVEWFRNKDDRWVEKLL